MAVKNMYIDKIMEKLSTLNLYKVLLFGSYASEKENEESDIDLIFVLNEDILPKAIKSYGYIKTAPGNPIECSDRVHYT